VVLLETLAQIVQQQRQVEPSLVGHVAISFADRVFALEEAGNLFDRLQAVLVHRKLVVLVELQQAAGVLHCGDDLFEISQLMQ
jgi:hypothetical protein